MAGSWVEAGEKVRSGCWVEVVEVVWRSECVDLWEVDGPDSS